MKVRLPVFIWVDSGKNFTFQAHHHNHPSLFSLRILLLLHYCDTVAQPVYVCLTIIIKVGCLCWINEKNKTKNNNFA